MAALVDLHDHPRDLPLGIPPSAPDGALDVAPDATGVAAHEDLDPPTVLPSLLNVASHRQSSSDT